MWAASISIHRRRPWVLCVGEKSQIQALDRTQPVLPMIPGVPERRSHDYVRAGTTTLFAALEVATGKVIGSLHRRHRAGKFKKFLTKLDKEVPAGLEVHLILNNYATHKTPYIKRWLLAHPRFHLHFTPTSASWQLNLVERWFAELTRKKLKRGVHRSVQALERDIRPWLANWNEHPRPFVWTKTADDFFRISGRTKSGTSEAGPAHFHCIRQPASLWGRVVYSAATIRSTAAVTSCSRPSVKTSGRVSCSTISQFSVSMGSLTAVASPGRPIAS
ncbi:hypothetical protein GCM10010346_64620 [Streptomyces chryseus]|uniref:Tc1-like transposase DDE domain-containing protein n=1 Tax=Streptomyces chryseus TaxID=68186 RepID=A0ABQ3EEQ5_9ACTN|nr:hypothetical protein GCM10010346_64620 [Streptomyces chryseus]